MKKRDKKLSLHRETVLRLDSKPLTAKELGEARGAAYAQPGFYTSCIEPDCCGFNTDGTA